MRFDTQNLEKVPSAWARVIGWSPQYLQIAITTTLVALLISGRRLWVGIRDADPDATRVRPPLLAVHLCAFALFVSVTSTVMSRGFSSNPHPGVWALAWIAAGAMSIVTWGLAALTREAWLMAFHRGRAGLCWGVLAGVAAWTGGFLTQEFWTPLARYTFSVVAWILRLVYVDTISDPSRLLVGTRAFTVHIAPGCSGYEGIGLIVAFLGIYLVLNRKHLRFPPALILLPIGAAVVWLLNAVRIAALIVIGTLGWRAIALDGFHSQAGWLIFNAVGLGLVAISARSRYFVTTTVAVASRAESHDPTAAYLAPFLAFVAVSMLTRVFSSGFDWLYPAQVVAAGAALWTFRVRRADLSWRWSWNAIAIGAVAFVLWLALLPAGVGDSGGWPAALETIPPGLAAMWLIVRVAGYVLVVPFAEELAFRGFLARRLLRADFHNVPIATWSWIPFLISSLLFGALHGRFWLAGTMAGMLFAVALYRGKALGGAVQAHAMTNCLIVLYVFATGHWSIWS